ncbi:glycosyltransferase involved in cell wall biosynthesis [Motilibacter peucedani]|uniref:Glycosyltransferase involved in cell wall biosynthesis n=1 Tax=Motilibacter peucedani TaxID=598650 RepID=A0A420XVD7_9ACTN|nr:glycosyltransferase [Motilibacter peucedani]RKS80737.1 glycosyltransferase involved in cell wall biosynthesis [Motilibacter peucedani]
MTRVSVLIDNYDYERFLGRAIDSALAQTHPDVEVVVVDDGSKDGSVEVARSYGDRVTVVTKPNGGQGSAVNEGFLHCTGEVVVVLDADDELRPEAAAKAVTAMGEGVAKVHWRLEAVDEDGAPLGHLRPGAGTPLASGSVREEVLRSGYYSSPAMSGNAYPRWVLERLLPMPAESFRISADSYLIALAGLLGDVVAVDEPLTAYRIHGSNGWRADTLTADRLRLWVTHDIARQDAVTALARELGLPVAADLGLGDPASVRARLASLRADGAHHPVASDTRLGLLRAGLRTTLADRSAGAKQRAFLSAWLVAVGLAPRPVSWPATEWFYVPARRPKLRRAVTSR